MINLPPIPSIRVHRRLRIHQPSIRTLRCPAAEVAQCEGVGSQSGCAISPICRLRGMFSSAQEAFYENLNQQTVGDLVTGQQKQLSRLLIPALKTNQS
ncbi:hypothetical protein N9Z95_02985 [Akkermansiaceae bacterium]|nr:hypothetical protein [Akkermansiaceae bacterium]MDB4388240.1 hypothetical protein [Akkermansiaceae bacterium]MDB4569969.1 hypothetical protein [Akkermansiaceae bacterium]